MLGTLTNEQIERVLHSQLTGRIGCHAGGRTYVVPITYAYDGESIYGHSSFGLKIAMMRENPEVCFEVEDVQSQVNWESVIAWGRYEELTGEDARAGMAVLMRRFLPLLTSKTARAPDETPDVLTTSAIVYRIRLSEKTGRCEKPDLPTVMG